MSFTDESNAHLGSSEPDLGGRLREMERQLLDLRRLVSRDRPTLPEHPFHALEIRLSGQSYLLPVEPVREVVSVVWPAPIPDAPSWVRGSFRYGPLLLAMVDLGHRLLGRPTPLSPELSLIVLQRPKWVGILAPVPTDVHLVDPAALVPPDPEIPQSPWVLASLPKHGGTGAHLLSTERLGREYVLGAG